MSTNFQNIVQSIVSESIKINNHAISVINNGQPYHYRQDVFLPVSVKRRLQTADRG